MKTVAVAVLLVVGCGDGGGQIDARLVAIDAFRPDAPCVSACNPADGTGCAVRCTYFHRADMRFPHCYETCADDPGTIPLGDSCTPPTTGIDDCVAGSVCRVDRCVPFCLQGSVPCTSGVCPSDELVCYLGCDPAAPTCPAGTQCALSTDGDELAGCVPIGSAVAGATCTHSEECGPGLMCLWRSGEVPQCVPMCVVDGSPCASGTCTPREPGEPYGGCL